MTLTAPSTPATKGWAFPPLYLVALGLSVWLIAARLINAAATDQRAHWTRVVRDANYDISIDTARVRGWIQSGYSKYAAADVWYRTDHKVPRLYKGKPFTREVVHSIVHCDSLWFRVVSVDMSMGDERPMAQQRMTPEEVARQGWRRVAMGTSEEMAAQAACHFAARRREDR